MVDHRNLQRSDQFQTRLLSVGWSRTWLERVADPGKRATLGAVAVGLVLGVSACGSAQEGSGSPQQTTHTSQPGMTDSSQDNAPAAGSTAAQMTAPLPEDSDQGAPPTQTETAGGSQGGQPAQTGPSESATDPCAEAMPCDESTCPPQRFAFHEESCDVGATQYCRCVAIPGGGR